MNFLDRLLGRRRVETGPTPAAPRGAMTRPSAAQPISSDERAVERYRYLLRTAPPETIEAAHAEAFARLTPEQRQLILNDLSQALPVSETSGGRANAADPRSLARLATRAEMRDPGTLERAWNQPSAGGVGMGGLMAGSFLGTIAGVVVGSAIADAFLGDSGSDQGAQDGAHTADDFGGDTADGGYDQLDAETELDSGFGDFGDFDGGDFGGDF